jgi:3-hydroxybutyrate dehydrogenase
VRRYGGVDILVLNAGTQHIAPIAELEEEDWDRLLNVMLKGPYLAIRAAWPWLTRRPGGRVVAIASGSSFRAPRGKAAYAAAKHGLLGLVKVTAIEGAPHGLTANAIAPGGMWTGMLQQQLDAQVELTGQDEHESIEGWRKMQPTGRFVDVEEVASVVSYLASAEASGVNGTCLPVDHGYLVAL